MVQTTPSRGSRSGPYSIYARQWHGLARVYQRWRRSISHTPSRANPMKKNLGYLPTLPIAADYGFGNNLTSNDTLLCSSTLSAMSDTRSELPVRIGDARAFSGVVRTYTSVERWEHFGRKVETLRSEGANASVLRVPSGFLNISSASNLAYFSRIIPSSPRSAKVFMSRFSTQICRVCIRWYI